MVAVFLVLLVLILSHVEAQRNVEREEWYLQGDFSTQSQFYSDSENVFESPRNVYDEHVLRRLHEYVDDEVMSVDVDEEEEQEEDVYEDYYHGRGFSLPHCPQNPAVEDEER